MNRIATIAQPILVPAVVGLSITAQLFALAIVRLMATPDSEQGHALAAVY